jgi:hypothetical protein
MYNNLKMRYILDYCLPSLLTLFFFFSFYSQTGEIPWEDSCVMFQTLTGKWYSQKCKTKSRKKKLYRVICEPNQTTNQTTNNANKRSIDKMSTRHRVHHQRKESGSHSQLLPNGMFQPMNLFKRRSLNGFNRLWTSLTSRAMS